MLVKKKLSVPRSVKREFPNVETCVDARSAIEVSVKQSDCTSGKRLKAAECALAVAAKRQFKADGAIIGLSKSYIIRGKKAVCFETPESVAREIVSFDRHHDFAPGTYKLCGVRPSQRRGTKRRKNDGSGPKTQHRIVHKETVRVRTLKA